MIILVTAYESQLFIRRNPLNTNYQHRFVFIFFTIQAGLNVSREKSLGEPIATEEQNKSQHKRHLEKPQY